MVGAPAPVSVAPLPYDYYGGVGGGGEQGGGPAPRPPAPPRAVGERLQCGDDIGTIKYVGEVSGYKGYWYGVEWDEPSRGKHDGCVEGTQYFVTSRPGAGSFVRPNRAAATQTCAEAIRKYYGDREDETTAAHRKTVINEWKREMKAPFIEMVGFEKIRSKQVKFECLQEACVHGQRVSRAGNLAELCPNLEILDVSRNLFSNWREVITLTAQLPQLRDLDLSKNRLAIDMPPDTLRQYSANFAALEKLNISLCAYEWSDVASLSHLLPGVREIVAAHNSIAAIAEPPDGAFSTLTTLRLDGNPIGWSDVMRLGGLRSLEILSLNDCEIDEIRVEEGAFGKLEVLFLNRNRINDWRSISELGKLPSLRKLYLLRNPVQASEDYDTVSQLVVAKIATLQDLNGSVITRELRRGSEYDYLKRYGAEWKKSRADPAARRAFDAEHPRFQDLVDKYGIPEDSLLEKQPKHTSLTSKLIEINLKDEHGNAFKKKFPSNMMVQKLATMAQRLFSKYGGTGTAALYCLDGERGNTEIPLDNGMKDLNYFSVRDQDTVLVRWR